MAPKNQHSRILLGKNEGGTIVYCEACEVVEVELGAISVRLDATSLEALSALFKDADIRLSYYRLEKARFEQVISDDLSFH
jgi:hypothetical protein